MAGGIQEGRKTNIVANNVASRLVARKLRRIRLAVNRTKNTISMGTESSAVRSTRVSAGDVIA